MQKDSTAAEEEMRKIREEVDRKEERSRLLSNKVDKNKMADAEMAAELQCLQAGEERRGSNSSQAGYCCMEALWQQINYGLGSVTSRGYVPKVQRSGSGPGQMPGREEGRRNNEGEQEKGNSSQQLVLPASRGCNEGTSATR